MEFVWTILGTVPLLLNDKRGLSWIVNVMCFAFSGRHRACPYVVCNKFIFGRMQYAKKNHTSHLNKTNSNLPNSFFSFYLLKTSRTSSATGRTSSSGETSSATRKSSSWRTSSSRIISTKIFNKNYCHIN